MSSLQRMDVVSVEFGYNPIMLESPRQLWITLKFPASNILKPGQKIRLNMDDKIGINTDGIGRESNSVFIIDDVVGYRISLKTSGKMPDFSVGYDTRTKNVGSSRQNWHYGYGDARSYIEFYPM